MIGYYKKLENLKTDEALDLDLFLESVKGGKWEDEAHHIRLITDETKRSFEKEKLPGVTIAGTFITRYDNKIEKHSGFIGIDIDKVDDPELLKERFKNDPYVYACFVTISGRGLCVIFKINGKKHRENYYSIAKYVYEKYKTVVDPTGINESRFRYVSYDPNIYINYGQTKQFDIKYDPPKIKVKNVIFKQSDFDRSILEIQQQQLNLCEDYDRWLRVAFAFANQFKEDGRQYFHIVSQFSAKYIKQKTDEQFTVCLNAEARDKEFRNNINISSFYYYCKEAGLNVYSNDTKLVYHSINQGKKGGLSKETIKSNLEKFEDIKLSDVEFNDLFNTQGEIIGQTPLDELEIFLRHNYKLRKNEISRYVENNGVTMFDNEYNSIFIKAKKMIPETNFELINRLINSDFVPKYNPLKDFIEAHRNDEPQTGLIDKLFECIETDNPVYTLKYGKKWFVSMIGGIYGNYSPLMLILCGKLHGTGKTEWFRRLLPEELLTYYAESKLDAGKDDFILMCQKLLLMDDEMSGKSKQEARLIKDISSKAKFDLREPYGRGNVTLQRLAILGGTANEYDVLVDLTGNRRGVPLMVYSINQQLYNSIDKTALFMEAVRLYESGFNYRILGEDIKELNESTEQFTATTLEGELLYKYFKPGKTPMQSVDIKIIIENASNQKINQNKLIQVLNKYNYEQKREKGYGQTIKYYMVDEIGKENKF